MTKAIGKNLVLILVLVLVALTGLFFLTDPVPKNRNALRGVSRNFVRILPTDLSEEQVEEIKGLFARFDQQVEAGAVVPADRDEVRADMQRHLEAGTISRGDLNTLMAKVGFYTMRNDPRFQHPDGSGIHPLLEKDKSDTTAATERGDNM